MKIETLKERIKKAEEKLLKQTATLERHQKQLVKKTKVVTDKGIDLNSKYDKYDRTKIDSDTYWDICDYEGKLSDIKSTEKKISETITSLEKYREQLKNQLAQDAELESLAPEVLKVFLENWKQKCIDFFTKLANEYIELLSKDYKEYDITKEELEKVEKKEYSPKDYKYIYVRRYSNEEIEHILNDTIPEYQINNIKSSIKDEHIRRFRNRRFASDISTLDMIITQEYTLDSIRLNKIFDEDIKIKTKMFISRIKEVIGDIKDLTGLTIGDNGEINGIAIGVKSKAKVETISAGGYNIQCFHFRVLVNTVK